MGFESGFTEFGGRDESARMVGGDSVGIGNGCHGLLGQVRAQQREREPAAAAGSVLPPSAPPPDSQEPGAPVPDAVWFLDASG